MELMGRNWPAASTIGFWTISVKPSVPNRLAAGRTAETLLASSAERDLHTKKRKTAQSSSGSSRVAERALCGCIAGETADGGYAEYRRT